MSFICPSNRLLPSYVLEWNCMTPELGERWCGLGQVMEQAFTVPLSPHSWRGGDYNSTSPQSSHVRTKQVNWYFYYYFFISVMPLGLWDFSSLTRGWTWDLSSEKLGVLSIGPPENSLNLHLPQFLAHWWRPGGSVVKKNLPANAGKLGSIPGLGRSPGGGMATHCSILAWKIPWTEEPGRL